MDLVEHCPYGMAIFDSKKRLVTSNGEFTVELGYDDFSKRVFIKGDYHVIIKHRHHKYYVYTQSVKDLKDKITQIRHDINSLISPVHGLIQLFDNEYTEKMMTSIDNLIDYTKEKITIKNIFTL